MHRRKEFLVYPFDYKPITGVFETYKSKYQALKAARRHDLGADVQEYVYCFPTRKARWTSTFGGRDWEVAPLQSQS